MNSTQAAKLQSFEELAARQIDRLAQSPESKMVQNETRGFRLTWTKALVTKYGCDKADINAAWNRAKEGR